MGGTAVPFASPGPLAEGAPGPLFALYNAGTRTLTVVFDGPVQIVGSPVNAQLYVKEAFASRRNRASADAVVGGTYTATMQAVAGSLNGPVGTYYAGGWIQSLTGVPVASFGPLPTVFS